LGYRVTADKAIATYRRMRAQPLWRLLASGNGPTVIWLLQVHLYEGDRSLPASILHERIGRDLEELRAQGEDFPQTAQAYVASWLADGYLERHFPQVLQRRSTNSRPLPSRPFVLSLASRSHTQPPLRAA